MLAEARIPDSPGRAEAIARALASRKAKQLKKDLVEKEKRKKKTNKY